MKIKITKHDRLFSKLVRERSNWTCEHSGINFRSDPGKLECAHIMGRRHVGLRWHPDNAFALSKKSHLFFTSQPFEWADWVKSRIGEDKLSELRRQSKRPVHWIKADKDSIYELMQIEYKRLLRLRTAGEAGRLDFARHTIMAVIE